MLRMDAKLIQKGWLRRILAVSTADGSYTVEYSGRGAGYETVAVNDEIVAGETSSTWFIPQFEFKVGTKPAVLDVRVWPWMALRSLSLSVDGNVLYSEGGGQARPTVPTADDTQAGVLPQLRAIGSGWHIAIQSIVSLLVLPSLFFIVRQVVRGGIESFGVAAPWDWPAFIALVVGLLAAWGCLVGIVYAGKHTTMTSDGVRQRRLFGSDSYLAWGEVREWSFRQRWILVLKGVRKEITMNFLYYRRPQAAREYAFAHLRRTHAGADLSAT